MFLAFFHALRLCGVPVSLTEWLTLLRALSLGLLWPIFSLGVGGRLGSGRQWWSFISLRDEVRPEARETLERLREQVQNVE